MPKEDGLIIEDFSKGIGASPHVGFGDMRNLDISSRPGVARVNYGTFKKSAGTVTDLVKWMERNTGGDANTIDDIYALGDTGGFYKSANDGLTWSAITGTYTGLGQGLKIWKNYAFGAGTTTLYVYGPLNGTAVWSSFKTIDSDSLFHPMIVSKNDGKLYGGAGKYIYSLDEVAGQTFDPATAGTYTWTQQALDLPANYRIKTLCELGENLMIGTWMGINITDLKVADIFPWDRSSSSFGTSQSLERNGVNAMLNINNIVFVLAGIDGEVFSTNGVQSALLAKVPFSITNMEAGNWLVPSPGAICNHKGKLFFGLMESSGASLGGMGVWSLTPTSNGNILNCEHLISTGNDGSVEGTTGVSALLPGQINTLLVGWQDLLTYGIDQVSNQLKYAQGTYLGVANSYPAWFESALYRVGTSKVKKQFTQLEFQLAKPLTAGQGLKFSYRTGLTGSYTPIGTYDFGTTQVNGTYLGPVSSYNANPINVVECEFIQIKGELLANSNSPYTSPELKTVKLL